MKPITQLGASLKNNIAYWLTLGFGRLSLPVAQALGRGLGYLLWMIPNPGKSVIKKNIRLCFKTLDTRAQNQLIKQSCINTSMTTCEAGPLWCKPIEHGQAFIQSTQNEHLLDNALADDRGLILILPHLGNWEMSNQYITDKTALMAMYKPLKLSKLENLIYQGRSRAGAKLVPANRSGVRQLYQWLRQGSTTIVLPDQEPDTDKGRGYFAPFFDIPAFTSPLVPRLLKETNAQALIIYCKRLMNGHFQICFETVDEGIYGENSKLALAAMNLSIEKAVLNCPEQYQWIYKRFKRRPAGDTSHFYD